MTDDINALADRIKAEMDYHNAGVIVRVSGERFNFTPDRQGIKEKTTDIVYHAPLGTTRGKIYGDLYKLYVHREEGVKIPSSLARYASLIQATYEGG